MVAVLVVAVYLAFRGASSLAGVSSTGGGCSRSPTRRCGRRSPGPRLLLAAVAGIVSAVILGGSLWLVARRRRGAARRRRRDRPALPRPHGPAHRWLLIAVVVFIIVRIAAAANSHLAGVAAVPPRRRPRPVGPRARRRPRLLPLQAAVARGGQRVGPPAAPRRAGARPRSPSSVSGGIRLPRNGPAIAARRRSPTLGLLGALFAGAQALDYVFVRRPAWPSNRAGSFVGAGLHRAATSAVPAPGSWPSSPSPPGSPLVWSVRAPTGGGRRSSRSARGGCCTSSARARAARRSSTASSSPRPRPTASSPTSTTTSKRRARRSRSTPSSQSSRVAATD